MPDLTTFDQHSDFERKIASAAADLTSLEQGMNLVLLGKEKLVRQVLVGMIAGGHILLEGMPGLGKTELVKGLSRLTQAPFARVQFTPDLLPGDITGSYLLEENAQGKREFKFQPGPLFAHLILADEINRASPKTQSALLEAMQEFQITVMGKTFPLPTPFFVLATQNPVELEGTYPLPEAQLDRFLFKLLLERPDAGTMSKIVLERGARKEPDLQHVITIDRLRELIALARGIHLATPVAEFIARVIEATQPDSPVAPETVKKYVKHGASPRAALALAAASRALALLDGKPQAGFQAVRDFAAPILRHRIILDYAARLDGVATDDVVEAILASTSELARPLPSIVSAAS